MGERSKKNFTISLNPGIHKQFKVETILNDADMSLTIESFMENYIKASKQLRLERIKKKDNG